MNFSGIGYRSLIGRLLRLPLTLLPKTVVLPILQGVLRGKWWIVGSSNHGCWLGSYEYESQRLLSSIIKPGAVFFDIGAHVGYYTLLASQLVGKTGTVYAFEPLPENLTYLHRHLKLNKVVNVQVKEAAVAETGGWLYFEKGATSFEGHVVTSGPIKVRAVSVDEIIKESGQSPDVLKIDVEGAELSVLQGAEECLMKRKPKIVLSLHSAQLYVDCVRYLEKIGYTVTTIGIPPSDYVREVYAEVTTKVHA